MEGDGARELDEPEDVSVWDKVCVNAILVGLHSVERACEHGENDAVYEKARVEHLATLEVIYHVFFYVFFGVAKYSQANEVFVVLKDVLDTQNVFFQLVMSPTLLIIIEWIHILIMVMGYI